MNLVFAHFKKGGILAEAAKRDTLEMRYLLGSLSEDEGTSMEEAFFADDAKFDELELAEDELIDAYMREELSTEERQQFETKLRTSSRLVERVHFARALAERACNPLLQEHEASIQPPLSVSQPASKAKVRWWEGLFGRQPAFQVAFAACVVLLLVGGVALVSGWLRLRSESERIQSERAALQRQKEELDQQSSNQQSRTDQLAADLQHERNERAQDQKLIEELQRGQKRDASGQRTFVGTVASLFLTPGALRSGGSSRQLTVGAHTATVDLKLALERNDYRSYAISVQSVNGAEVFKQKGLKPRKTRSGQILVLSVPSGRLPPDDYIVRVHGLTSSGQLESVNDYGFSLTMK